MLSQNIKTFPLVILCKILCTWSVAQETNSANNNKSCNGNADGTKQYRQFLHVSDFHFDRHYASEAGNDSCKPRKSDTKPYGQYGDYECDPPQVLIESAIDYMKNKFPNPDFILWTG